jgi:hypothetical protein
MERAGRWIGEEQLYVKRGPVIKEVAEMVADAEDHW